MINKRNGENKMFTNLKGEEIKIGDKVLCYDVILEEMKRGVVVDIYEFRSSFYNYTDEYVADIDFEYRNEISKGHFVSGLRVCYK